MAQPQMSEHTGLEPSPWGVMDTLTIGCSVVSAGDIHSQDAPESPQPLLDGFIIAGVCRSHGSFAARRRVLVPFLSHGLAPPSGCRR